MIDYYCDSCRTWMDDKICPTHNTKNNHINDYKEFIVIDIHNLYKHQSEVIIEGLHCSQCGQTTYAPILKCYCGGDIVGFVEQPIYSANKIQLSVIKKEVKIKNINGKIIVKNG